MNLNLNDKFKQGVFTPKNKGKFIGNFAVYRSSYELKFMRWADNNANVLEWSSERIIVPYISPIDRRGHRYYVDFYITIMEGHNKVKYLVEIKPEKQTKPPTVSKKKKRETVIYEQTQWTINQAKWQAATEYAKARGMKFIVITEKELFV